MNIKLIFAGEARSYTQGLSRLFINERSLHYDLAIYFEKEPFLLASRAFDLNTFLVLDENFYEALPEDFKVNTLASIIFLTENITARDINESLCIFKYQNIRDIFHKINDFILSSSSGELVNKLGKKADLYLFYSPLALAGTSLMAEMFSFMRAREGKRVLYISFASFSKIRFLGESRFSASDFFVSADKETNILMNLSKMKASYQGVDYLLPFTYELDKSVLDESILEKVISYIREKGEYELICVDLDRAYFSYFHSLIDASTKAVIISNNNTLNADRYYRFKDEISKVYRGKYDDKIISIFNKNTKDKGIIECNYALNFDESLVGLSYLDDMILGGSFARGIRGIFDER